MSKPRIAIVCGSGHSRMLGAAIASVLGKEGLVVLDSSAGLPHKSANLPVTRDDGPPTAWAGARGNSRRAQWKDETNYKGRRR